MELFPEGMTWLLPFGDLARPSPKEFGDSIVAECSISTYQSNREFEDRHFVVPVVPLDGGNKRKGTVFGVMDGHGGWQTAEFTRVNLPGVISEEVKQVSTSSDDNHAEKVRGSRDPLLHLASWECSESPQVGEALKRSFLRVDDMFANTVLPAFNIGFWDLSKVGCCAVVAAVTPSHVVVANGAMPRSFYHPPLVLCSVRAGAVACALV